MSCIVCCVALLSGMLRDVIRWCGADCGDQKVAAGLWGVSLKIGWEMLPFPHSTAFSLDPDSHKKRQWNAGAPETANIWNPLSGCVNRQTVSEPGDIMVCYPPCAFQSNSHVGFGKTATIVAYYQAIFVPIFWHYCERWICLVLCVCFSVRLHRFCLVFFFLLASLWKNILCTGARCLFLFWLAPVVYHDSNTSWPGMHTLAF